MNIQYPVSEILKSVEGINEPKKKIDKSDYKPSISLNNLDMKKKITHHQGTFGETFELEEQVEEISENADPFEIEEIKLVDRSQTKQNNTENKDVLLLIHA